MGFKYLELFEILCGLTAQFSSNTLEFHRQLLTMRSRTKFDLVAALLLDGA